MKSLLKNTLPFLILVPLLLVGFMVSPKSASAACVINDVNVNPHGVQPISIGTVATEDDFPAPENPYRDSDANGSGYVEDGYTDPGGANGAHSPPYVYIDVQTSGCDGKTFALDISDHQWANEILQFESISPTIILAGPIGLYTYLLAQLLPEPEAASAIAFHAIINVGPSSPAVPADHHTNNDNFTIAVKAGEENCVQDPGEFDCKYIFLLSATGVQAHALGTFALPELMYDCDGVACNQDWQWAGINEYQGRNDAPSASASSATTGMYFTEGYDAYLAPLPGLPDQNCSTPPCSGLGPFLKALFTILIMLAGILAFIMLVIGGITYATANAIDGHSSGKDMMWNAVLGLIIALGAWVILNTINPKLASDLSITIPKATFDDVSPEWKGGNAPTGTRIAHETAKLNGQPIAQGMPWPSDATQRDELAGAGITINTANNCTPTAGGNGCTSVYFEGDAAGVIAQIIAFKSACGNCEIVITGGSEAWLHRTHGPNKKVIDMRSTDTLNAYLRGLPGGPVPGNDFPTGKTISVPNFGKFYAEPAGSTSNTTSQHWHVIFN